MKIAAGLRVWLVELRELGDFVIEVADDLQPCPKHCHPEHSEGTALLVPIVKDPIQRHLLLSC
jgi:hypothetical protein